MPRIECLGDLSESDWRHLLALAQEQAVTGLCYPALVKLPAGYRPSMDTLLQWYGRTGYIEQCNRHLRKVWDELNERNPTENKDPDHREHATRAGHTNLLPRYPSTIPLLYLLVRNVRSMGTGGGIW